MEANCVLYGLRTQYTATSCRISSTLLYGARTLAKLCMHLGNMQRYTQNSKNALILSTILSVYFSTHHVYYIIHSYV